MEGPGIFDIEVSVRDTSGLYAERRAPLPKVNLLTFRFNCQVDAVKPRNNR